MQQRCNGVPGHVRAASTRSNSKSRFVARNLRIGDDSVSDV
jgi:hypothetical protein